MSATHTPTPQSPPSILMVVAALFIAIILAIAAFIFGRPVATEQLPPESPGLEEPANPPVEDGEGVACTMDAKICPDGSAVGRIPPSCEFAPCPGE